MKTLEFAIGQLLNVLPGESQSCEFNAMPEKNAFGDLEFEGEISGLLTLMRMYGSIHAKVENFESKIILQCQRCLQNYTFDVDIPELEGVFHENIEKSEGVQDEDFEIDMKNHRIDISEMLRQEIILHFPIVSVCSESCKGLCPFCGSDLSKKNCNCEETNGYKPLSILKEIYNGKTSSTQKKDL